MILDGLALVLAAVVGAVLWAEIVGSLSAWLRLRGTEAWQRRPPSVRRLDLVSGFLRPIRELAAGFGLLVGLAVWVGTLVS